jgi:hypothetical protein
MNLLWPQSHDRHKNSSKANCQHTHFQIVTSTDCSAPGVQRETYGTRSGISERLQETPYNHLGQKTHQATPIMPVSAEKSINSVFSHLGGSIPVYPGENVPTHKGQLKDNSQNH